MKHILRDYETSYGELYVNGFVFVDYRLPLVVASTSNMSVWFLCLFFISVRISKVWCCHTFKDTKVMVVTRAEEYVEKLITGCIERKTLDVNPIEILVKNQNIPRLRRDDVRHLVRLTAISFDHCRILEVEPDLFRNVPNLQSVKIAFNDLVEIKRGIFTTLPSLRVLVLNNNNIESIEDGAFSNSTTLIKIYCYYNLLTEWKEAWFNNSTNLEIMDFRFNKIRELPSFGNFKKLKVLRFGHNEVEIIHSGAFEGLKKLNQLDLRHNKLTTIDWRIFPWDLAIDTLSIGANYLNYLPRRLMAMITVRELEVQGNPWKCPCLDQIFNWLYEINGTVLKTESCSRNDVPVCASPSSHSFSCLEKKDEQVTNYFFEKLKTVHPPLDKSCARLF